VHFYAIHLRMVTPEQCRAARAWLGWNQDELSRRATVSVSSIRDFEGGKRTPFANNLLALERALSEAGVSFEFDGGQPIGLRVRRL
jgi:transcriptional regulator with XRE-family HTH domain